MILRKTPEEVIAILSSRGLKLAAGCDYQGMHAPLTVVDDLGRLRTAKRAFAFLGPSHSKPKTDQIRQAITPERAALMASQRGWELEVPQAWCGGKTLVHVCCPGGGRHSEPHAWTLTARKLVHGRPRCPACEAAMRRPKVQIQRPSPKGTVFEPLTRIGLQWLTGHAFVATRPTFLREPGDRGCLSLDGWCPTLRIAAEFQGRQHYAWIPFFHPTRRAFEEAQARDVRKAARLAALGIPLIVVPHHEVTVETLDAFLRKELVRLGINLPLNPLPIPIDDPAQLGLDQAMLDDSRIREAARSKGLEVLVYRGMRAKAVLRCEKGHIIKTHPSNLVSRTKEVKQSDGSLHRVPDPVGCDACRRVRPEDLQFAAFESGLEVREDLRARDVLERPLGCSDSRVEVRCTTCGRAWDAHTQNLLHGAGCTCRTRRPGITRSRARRVAPPGWTCPGGLP